MKQIQQPEARIFLASDRLHRILLDALHPSLWNAPAPAHTRTVGAIFCHVHNIRLKWLRLSAPHLKRPAQLARAHASPKLVAAALAQSASACSQMLTELLNPQGSQLHFLRDGWARPWPPGPEVLAYMLTHEAHHRGQICMLAHQLGHPLAPRTTAAMWNWERLWKKL